MGEIQYNCWPFISIPEIPCAGKANFYYNKIRFMYFHPFNRKSLEVLSVAIAILFTSCEKDPLTIFKNGNSHLGRPVVLVAGYESNGTNNVAKYWIDGHEVILSDGTNSAQANSIFVSDNDLYIAGSDNGAVYWKNNSEIRLSGSDASSVFVSGNDVYVAGSDGTHPVYWKNGSAVLLERTNAYGNYGSFGVNSIFVSDNDVYAAGYDGPNAVYWKNGAETYLTFATISETGYVHANSIYVSGNDVYIVGHQISAGTPFPQLWYWKNGIYASVNKVNSYGKGNSVFVSEGHVYLAGMQESDPTYVPTAAYWKDGNVTLLQRSEVSAFANSVFPSGNNVYAAGYEDVDYLHSYAVYWKDGVETKLTDGTHLAYATSIYIK